jgi:hypothetical protein
MGSPPWSSRDGKRNCPQRRCGKILLEGIVKIRTFTLLLGSGRGSELRIEAANCNG